MNIKYLLAMAAMSLAGTAIAATEEPDTIVEPSVNLDDFVVTSQKKVIKSDGAKLTYDVQADESTKGQSLLDALRKVPMVTVDAQDNIQINGNSGFKIYVNGKEDVMLEANYQKVFKAMPADAVQNIEVITEPGAKYDAEGFGGILNLITETKQKNDGYNGSISGAYGTNQAYASAFITTKVDKVTLNANLTYARNGLFNQKNRNSSETTYRNSDLNYRMLTDMRQEIGFDMEQASLNMSWEPNDRNLFTLGGSFNNLSASIDKLSSTNRMFDRQNNLVWSFRNKIDGGLSNLGASANASYRIGFNQANTHRLILAYLFDYGTNDFHLNTETDEAVNYPVNDPWLTSRNDNYNRTHTVQADYSNPFGKGTHTLDAGFKGIFRRNTAISSSGVGPSLDQIVMDVDNNVNMGQNQDVYAGYLSYTGTFADRVSLTAGIRYEYTAMGLRFKDDRSRNFTKHLNDWVPNAALTYSFGPAINLRLAYQMRIWRPALSQVNPFRTQFNELEIQMGNPDLSSERNHVISLTYTNFGRILGGNVYARYEENNNSIVDYTYYDGITRVSTYGNYGRTHRFTLGGFLNYNITNSMSLSLNGSASYVDLKAKTINAHNHGWSANYGINWNWKAPADFKLNAGVGQSIHNVNLQGHSTGYYYYGIGISRDFLKNKSLNVGVSAWNFLKAYKGGKWYNNTADASSVSQYSIYSPSITLSVSWTFGHLKERVKSTGLDLKSDDTSTTTTQSSAPSVGK